MSAFCPEDPGQGGEGKQGKKNQEDHEKKGKGRSTKHVLKLHLHIPWTWNQACMSH